MAIKIHIIAPYQAMIPIIKECLPFFSDVEIDYSVGDLKQGVEIAKEQEKKGIDVLISRGGTAQLIKKSVKIPVIDIQLSGYDMIRSLILASNLNDRTAIVGFSNITSGAQSVIELLDFPLQVYTVTEVEELPALIQHLKNMGYKQIVGDVITMEVSNSYGLKGFLIQSGKESIFKAVEDAKVISGYLKSKNKRAQIIEQYMYKKYRNIIILDEQGMIVLEHLQDFNVNPLTKEEQSVLVETIAHEKTNVMKIIKKHEYLLRISGYPLHFDNQLFNILIMDKLLVQQPKQRGISIEVMNRVDALPLIGNSLNIIIRYAESLYKNNEIIALIGERGTGKDYLVNYLHQQQTGDGLMLSVDLLECTMESFNQISLENIQCVKILNGESAEDVYQLKSFIADCRKREIRIIFLSEYMNSLVIKQIQNVNQIYIPSLTDRREEIGELANHFLSQFHQKYGTTAVKFQKEALELLEKIEYPLNIDDLRELIYQLALNEKGYVINKETIKKVVHNNASISNQRVLKGTLKDIEKEIIREVLEEENFNQTKTAERLGINRATLWRKLKD